jgi:putative membrane protein
MLSAEERARVEEAIREAERDTAGEIAVVVAGQAAAYALVPVLYGLVLALIVPWPLVTLTTFSAGTIYIVQLLVALVSIAALAWPGRRHALVPGIMRRRGARDAAMREFTARGFTRTRDRTGVLIYVAGAERHVEIVADTGLLDRLEAGGFEGVRGSLAAAVAAGRAGEGLVEAVREIGRVLANLAPPRPDDWDELPDKVVVI